VKEFTVYTMMSPNGDGINDLLYIESIDKFPNSELYIYNRWGSQVHYAKGYQNNWDGTWNGKALPDGTYFYLLNLHNPAQKENLSGYIQIHR
jgi:gliding motility-associated-like protein